MDQEKHSRHGGSVRWCWGAQSSDLYLGAAGERGLTRKPCIISHMTAWLITPSCTVTKKGKAHAGAATHMARQCNSAVKYFQSPYSGKHVQMTQPRRKGFRKQYNVVPPIFQYMHFLSTYDCSPSAQIPKSWCRECVQHGETCKPKTQVSQWNSVYLTNNTILRTLLFSRVYLWYVWPLHFSHVLPASQWLYIMG